METELKRNVKFRNIYENKFFDRSSFLPTAGILTVPKDDIQLVDILTHNQPEIEDDRVKKFKEYTTVPHGKIRRHYGHYFDDIRIDSRTKSYDFKESVGNCINPKTRSAFINRRDVEIPEQVYELTKPKLQEFPSEQTFGIPNAKRENAWSIIRPDDSQNEIAAKDANFHELYIKSHCQYYPGEKKLRNYTKFNENNRFGEKSGCSHDGKKVREIIDDQCRERMLPKEIEHYNLRHRTADPLSAEHTYGISSLKDPYGIGDVIAGRNEEEFIDIPLHRRNLHTISVLRSLLQKIITNNFRSKFEAFSFFKQNNNLLNSITFFSSCQKLELPIQKYQIDELFKYIGIESENGLMTFTQFCNYCCLPNTLSSGLYISDKELLKENTFENSCNDEQMKDELGDVDIETINNRLNSLNIIKEKVINKTVDKIPADTFDSTYRKMNLDIQNYLPSINSSSTKNAGIPTIRNDLRIPFVKKVTDTKTYVSEGTVSDLVSPNIFTKNGIHRNDLTKERNKEEMFSLCQRFDIDQTVFEHIWKKTMMNRAVDETNIAERTMNLQAFLSAI
ncbi:hypothetical protein SNEBB_010126 [Seison nebaliae]|nr:hypothetical protein SNEBB_010126 [Seison nebaliae]